MSSYRLKLAVVARRAPVPVFTGISLIVHNITVRLARLFTVEAFITDDSPPAVVTMPSVPLHAFGPAGYTDKGAGPTTGPFRNAVARFYSVPLEREQWLRAKLAAFAPAVVIGFGYDTAPYLDSIRNRYAIIHDPIDSEVLHLWRQLRRGRLDPTGLKHLLVAVQVARQHFARAEAVVTVSEEDSANLRWWASGTDVVTIPNGVDSDYFAPGTATAVPGRVIFTGSLGWPPNAQAIEWFLDHCWQEVLRERPDASLVIVGKGMRPEQREAFERHARVSALGFVGDIREHVRAAEVSIAPMVSGSGIKNKILEASAMGRAVVATPVAVRGLPSDAGGFVVADDAAGFSRAVLSVLADGQLRRSLAEAGRRTAVERFSWDASASAFADVVRHAAAKRACSAASGMASA